MSRERIEDLLFRTIEHQPGMVFDLLENQDSGQDSPPAGPDSPHPETEYLPGTSRTQKKKWLQRFPSGTFFHTIKILIHSNGE